MMFVFLISYDIPYWYVFLFFDFLVFIFLIFIFCDIKRSLIFIPYVRGFVKIFRSFHLSNNIFRHKFNFQSHTHAIRKPL